MQIIRDNRGKVMTESDLVALELNINKDMEIIMNNKFDIEKYKDVTIIPPFVLNEMDKVDEVKREYWTALRNLALSSMKESRLPIEQIELEAIKKIRFVIEDKFTIEGLIPLTILPIYEMQNGQVVKEDYTIEEFNVEVALELQSPIKEDLQIQSPIKEDEWRDDGEINVTYTYSNLIDRLKKVFAKRVFMYYPDVKNKNNILYDFEKYIDSTFLMSNIMEYALLGYDTIEYRKMGAIIQIILKNEENFELHSEINSHEIKTIRKKYYSEEQFEADRFFDMEYSTK